jgi:hypothetical protein
VSRHQRSATDYFLGARNLPAWAILLSIVATETSALTVISIPGIGARGDLAFLQLTFGYLIGRIAVARWLLPGYFRGDQETAYARLESRFGVGTRRLTSLIFLVSRFFGDAVRVFASAIPLALITGWSVPTAIVVMGVVTMVYTWFGGFKAVVWTDVLQLSVYLAGGVGALLIAWHLAGGADLALVRAHAAGKLRILDLEPSLTHTYTLLSGIVGGALLSAASHGADHLIVQRLLATRSLRDARVALVGSGVMVILQFTLFLLVGSAIWAAGLARPDGATSFPPSSSTMPAGLRAGHRRHPRRGHGHDSSAINSLASRHATSMPSDRPARPPHLLQVGRLTLGWGVGLIGRALLHAAAAAGPWYAHISIASVTQPALLGTYFLAGRWPRARGRDVVGAVAVTVAIMLVVVFAKRISATAGLEWLEPVGRLAWPWYVPLGTLLAVGTGVLLSYLPDRTPASTSR